MSIDIYFLLTFNFVISLVSSECFDSNIQYSSPSDDIKTLSWRSPHDCHGLCNTFEECSHWTWTSGTCHLKSGQFWSKIPHQGSISGIVGQMCLEQPVRGRECGYEGTKNPVQCIFADHSSTMPVDVTNTTFIKNGVKTCVNILDQDNKMNSTTETKGKKRKNVVCQDTIKVPSLSALESLQKENSKLKEGINQLHCLKWHNWGNWGKCECKSFDQQGTCSTGYCYQERFRHCSVTSVKMETEKRKCSDKTCNKKSTYSSVVQQRSGSLQASGSCSGRCGQSPQPGAPCQCHAWCQGSNTCCPDYASICKSGSPVTFPSKPMKAMVDPFQSHVSGEELTDLSSLFEHLLSNDEHNVHHLVNINIGCKTRRGPMTDCSPDTLLHVNENIWSIPTFKKIRDLYDNYVEDASVKEDRTRNERSEEDAFINEVMTTQTMKTTLSYLRAKNLFTKSDTEFKSFLTELWFETYSRGNRIKGSSGFEHVFLGEKKNDKVQGFHNWLYFYYMEEKNKINYFGHRQETSLGTKASLLSFSFAWGQEKKSFGSMLIGTSPEFELAVYTTCLLAHGEEKCKFSLGGKNVALTSHVFSRPGGVKYIASVFFDLA